MSRVALSKEMDARRDAKPVVPTTGKLRNEADVPSRRNPPGPFPQSSAHCGRGQVEYSGRLLGTEVAQRRPSAPISMPLCPHQRGIITRRPMSAFSVLSPAGRPARP